jgi:(hydroxyamino)benzene mutase
MTESRQKRKLIWHGFFLFLLGLLVGFIIQSFKNPRMALSTHLAGLMFGPFLWILGIIWNQLVLSFRVKILMYWLAVLGSYVNWIALLLAAILGTSSMTPIAGGQHRAGALWEIVVNVGVISSAIATVLACILVLVGLRKNSKDE